MKVNAFQGLRPAYELAEEISSVPSDSVDAQEASRLTWDNPFSLLHVLRAEVDLEEGAEREAVLRKGRENFEAYRQQELWIPEEAPTVYLYQLEGPDGKATGIVMEGACAEFPTGHEVGEFDLHRARMEALSVAFEPVSVAYKDEPFLEMLKGEVLKGEAVVEFTDPVGVAHRLWRVPGEAVAAYFEKGFETVTRAFVVDGAVHLEAARENGRFLGVFFPESEAFREGEFVLPTLRSGLFARFN